MCSWTSSATVADAVAPRFLLAVPNTLFWRPIGVTGAGKTVSPFGRTFARIVLTGSRNSFTQFLKTKTSISHDHRHAKKPLAVQDGCPDFSGSISANPSSAGSATGHLGRPSERSRNHTVKDARKSWHKINSKLFLSSQGDGNEYEGSRLVC